MLARNVHGADVPPDTEPAKLPNSHNILENDADQSEPGPICRGSFKSRSIDRLLHVYSLPCDAFGFIFKKRPSSAAITPSLDRTSRPWTAPLSSAGTWRGLSERKDQLHSLGMPLLRSPWPQPKSNFVCRGATPLRHARFCLAKRGACGDTSPNHRRLRSISKLNRPYSKDILPTYPVHLFLDSGPFAPVYILNTFLRTHHDVQVCCSSRVYGCCRLRAVHRHWCAQGLGRGNNWTKHRCRSRPPRMPTSTSSTPAPLILSWSLYRTHSQARRRSRSSSPSSPARRIGARPSPRTNCLARRSTLGRTTRSSRPGRQGSRRTRTSPLRFLQPCRRALPASR